MIDTTKKCSISVAETKNIHYLIKRLHSTPTFQQTFWSKSEEKKSQGTWGSWDSSWLQICIQDDLEQTTHQAARHVTPRVNVEHALLDSIPSRNTNLCRPLQELFFFVAPTLEAKLRMLLGVIFYNWLWILWAKSSQLLGFGHLSFKQIQACWKKNWPPPMLLQKTGSDQLGFCSDETRSHGVVPSWFRPTCQQFAWNTACWEKKAPVGMLQT